MWVAIGGIGIILWLMWDKQTGLFAPGGLLANAIPPPGASSTSAATNTSTLPSSQTSAANNLVAPIAGQVLVPMTINQSVNGMRLSKRYRISNCL